jgi:hypothetical protein
MGATVPKMTLPVDNWILVAINTQLTVSTNIEPLCKLQLKTRKNFA